MIAPVTIRRDRDGSSFGPGRGWGDARIVA